MGLPYTGPVACLPEKSVPARILSLTCLAMLAFAGNSLLARLALRETSIDAASFTSVRLLAGAATLCLLLWLQRPRRPGGSYPAAVALFGYAAFFSFAYLQLDTGIGALLLFGAVQLSMLLYGLWQGERLSRQGTCGLLLALAGLVALLLPGGTAPPLGAALMMVLAGVAWGAYSLLGRGVADPLAATAGNFLRAAPMALALSLLLVGHASPDLEGMGYAVLSGALTSGVGYAIWYSALPGLTAMQAATVQLSVPVIAALGGAWTLAEPLTPRLLLSAVAVLGGVGLVLAAKRAQSL